MYGSRGNPSLMADVTMGILEETLQWQQRPLEPVYPIVYFVESPFVSRRDDPVRTTMMHIALAVRFDGRREVLGMWIDRHESNSFWLAVLSDLQSRGIKDLLVAVSNGREDLSRAHEAVFSRPALIG